MVKPSTLEATSPPPSMVEALGTGVPLLRHLILPNLGFLRRSQDRCTGCPYWAQGAWCRSGRGDFLVLTVTHACLRVLFTAISTGCELQGSTQGAAYLLLRRLGGGCCP